MEPESRVVRLSNRSRNIIDEIKDSPVGADYIKSVLRRGFFVVLGVVAIYAMQEQLREVLSAAERLRTIKPGWFAIMAIAQTVSFACMWILTKIVLPKVSWFVAITSQLASNAVSRVVPGGAAIGGATLFRMLAVSGVDRAQAGGALASTSILTTAGLFAIPASAGLLALAGAQIPDSLLQAAFAGGALFVIFVVVGSISIRFTRPLRVFGEGLNWVWGRIGRLRKRDYSVNPDRLIEERDRLVSVVGPRWLKVLLAVAGKWAFDYFTLIASLYGVGAQPRFSLVLLAYAGAAVLSMVPITPGGFGFVEVGLTSILVLSGISLQDATLATMAYRVASLWFPIIAGMGAWGLFTWQRPSLVADAS